MSAIHRTFAKCNKNMGSPCLFSPCVPVNLKFFPSCARSVRIQTTVKNSYFIAKLNLTKTLSPFFRLSYIFSVKTPQITLFWEKCREMESYHAMVLRLRGSQCGNSCHSYLTKIKLLLSRFFLLNIYFCVAITNKNTYKNGRSPFSFHHKTTIILRERTGARTGPKRSCRALARSGAPWIRKLGNLCIQEILVALLLAKPLSDLDNPDCLDFPVSWNKNLK